MSSFERFPKLIQTAAASFGQGPGQTPEFGGAALEELPDKVVEANSAGIDSMTGATITSKAFLAAVQDIITKAQQPSCGDKPVEYKGADSQRAGPFLYIYCMCKRHARLYASAISLAAVSPASQPEARLKP